MYTPQSFQVDDLATLHSLMRDYNFATLISHEAGSVVATHLPFLLDADRGPNGTLVSHMARANPHWQSWTESTEVVVIFQGPHSYISPSWYVNQIAVPTWNYAAVHAYGTPSLLDDRESLRDIIDRLVAFQEGPLGNPWDPSQAEPMVEALLEAIVGFEIAIDRLEGKFKFNQNRSREDQESVAQALEGTSDPSHRAVADIMRANLESESS